MQVAHTCCFHMLTCNALKLNIIVCVTEGMRLYALVTLMYKLARAQRHLKKKKDSYSTENAVFLCGRLQ